MSISSLYRSIQESTLPGVWSKGVALSRSKPFAVDRAAPGELVVRVLVPDRPIKPKVTLWFGSSTGSADDPAESQKSGDSDENDDAFCDCGDRVEPCVHVVAAIVGLKTGLIDAKQTSKTLASDEAGTPAHPSAQQSIPSRTEARASVARIAYRLIEQGEELAIARTIVKSGGTQTSREGESSDPSAQRETPLGTSLVALLGGVRSGRISGPAPAASQEDLALDALLSPLEKGAPGSGAVPRGPVALKALKLLEGTPLLSWQGETLEVQSRPLRPRAKLRALAEGFELSWEPPPEADPREAAREGRQLRVFKNGFLLTRWPSTGSSGEARGPESATRPRASKLGFFQHPDLNQVTRYRGEAELRTLLQRALPELETLTGPLELPPGLPRLVSGIAPRVLFHLQSHAHSTLTVLPRIVYPTASSAPGSAPRSTEGGGVSHEENFLAEVTASGGLETRETGVILERDFGAEKALARRLQTELHLSPGKATRFEGAAAVAFRARLAALDPRHWGLSETQNAENAGFAALGELEPYLARSTPAHDGRLPPGNPAARWEIRFRVRGTARSETDPQGSAQDRSREADPARAFEAWKSGQGFVPLIGGGWARVPEDWFTRHGARIASLLTAKASAAGHEAGGSEKHAKTGSFPNRGPGPGGSPARESLPTVESPSASDLLLAQVFGAPQETAWPGTSREGRAAPTALELPPGLRTVRERFIERRGIPEPKLPSDLRAELRSYQRDGIAWLQLLRDSGIGALLADDMGLGKTLQALATLPEAGRGRSLIVCPTSVLQGWKEQIERFRPGLEAVVYHGPDRELPRAGQKTDIVLTSHAIARLDLEKLAAEDWDQLVLDEAQAIRNPDSQAAQALHALARRARWRLALSGTPVENRAEDLWSQLEFANPGLVGERSEFAARAARDPALARGDAALFILRRLKKSVARELPERTEVVLRCELSTEERAVYEAILASTRSQVLRLLDEGAGVFGALEALLRLRQACCALELVPGAVGAAGEPVPASPNSRTRSSKLGLLLGALANSIEAGHRALVFSQWTSYLDLVEKELTATGWRWSRLDGSTRDRAGVIEEFQRPDGPELMLLSLKAGGVGVTLTAADHVYLMDPWWNPAAEDQAADRVHRIGQTQPVLIHRLVAQDTIEERVLLLAQEKRLLAEALLSGQNPAESTTGNHESGPFASAGLSREEIRALLI